MATPPADGRVGRRRRTTEELRQVILEAARELFEQRGFRSTTTRDIATRADVVEALIYRHFGTKADLFRTVIVEPFSAELDALTATFDPRVPAMGFLSALYRLLRRERGKVQALLSAGAFGAAGGTEPRFPVEPIFERLQQVTDGDVEHYRFEHVDVELTTAVCFGSLLGMVAFEDWLFAGGLPEERVDALVSEALVQIVHGLAHRPGPARR